MTRTLLFRLGRELRYRALPELVGRTIEPDSVDAVLPALGSLVEPWLGTAPAWLAHTHLPGALAKYGLIDIACSAPPSLLADASRGISVLRANQFLPAKGQRWDDDVQGGPFDGDPTCLEELVSELDRNTCWLKLYLVEADGESRRGLRLKLPPGYFPRRFVVDDACVTNASSIWFHKHFYL